MRGAFSSSGVWLADVGAADSSDVATSSGRIFPLRLVNIKIYKPTSPPTVDDWMYCMVSEGMIWCWICITI